MQRRNFYLMELAYAILNWTSAASHKSQCSMCKIYTANMIFSNDIIIIT